MIHPAKPGTIFSLLAPSNTPKKRVDQRFLNFLLSLVPGMWAADAADAAVEGAKLGAEALETMVNQGPVGQHRRALDWANSLEDPSAEDLP